MTVERSLELRTPLPAHRLLPVALVAPERRLVVAPVCGARTLAEGKPPLGIACAQQDLARIYPLPDDPERCLAEFAELAAEHARELAQRLERQEASVERFLELSGEDPPPPRRAAAALSARSAMMPPRCGARHGSCCSRSGCSPSSRSASGSRAC